MRAAFGLVGILAFLVAIILIWHFAYLPYTQTVLKSGKSAREQVEQMAGVDTTVGGRVSDNVKFEPVMAGSKLRGLQVKSIALGSSYQSHYGILLNDVIEQVGPQTVRDIDDAEMAKALAYEAYQRQWELGVIRNGQHLMLPQPKQVVSPLTPAAPGMPAAPGTPAATPGQAAAPANGQPGQAAQPVKQPEKPYQSPLNRQLDAITNYGQ